MLIRKDLKIEIGIPTTEITRMHYIMSSPMNFFYCLKFAASEFLEYINKSFTYIRLVYHYLIQNEEVLKFGEKVALNKGMIAKAFKDIDEVLI